ncbi:MAG: MoaD/ThiS family protein [Verrucomicrobiota bacterium]
MKTIRLQYFAILREQRGLAHETLITGAPTAAALYDELRARHGFTLPGDRLRVAINGEFAPWGTLLADGAELVFIPPVAGG